MKMLEIEVPDPRTNPLVVPVGIGTPHEAVTHLTVTGGQIAAVATEPDLGTGAALVQPTGGPLTLRYAIADAAPGAVYPDAMFRPRRNRHTAAASELVAASREIAAAAGGGAAGIAALVAEAEARFDYGHPEARFTDGRDDVPYLSCGLTPGSCVDINTYLVASLRAAGYEAGYVYGFFFPRERGGMTDDGHCWIVTRHGGDALEWDVAHHLKAGLGPTRPGLNPRPGARIALTHSMGHRYAFTGGDVSVKLLGEPLAWDRDRGNFSDVAFIARLHGVTVDATAV